MKADEVQTFVIRAKTPRKQTLSQAGFRPTKQEGVYETDHYVLRHVKLIVLNELSDEGHNVFVKCFASVTKEKGKAIDFLRRISLRWL